MFDMKIIKFLRSSKATYSLVKEKSFLSKFIWLKKKNFDLKPFKEIPTFLREEKYFSKNIKLVSYRLIRENISSEAGENISNKDHLETIQKDDDQEVLIKAKHEFSEKTQINVVWKSNSNKTPKEYTLPRIFSLLQLGASLGCTVFEKTNINKRHSFGKTLIFKAVEIRALQCVKVLMKYTYIKNNIIRATLCYIMQKYGDQEIEVIKSMYDRLKKSTRKAETLNYLHKLCYAREDISVIKVAQMLLENEDVNSIDLKERTPLMLAVQTKKKDLVEVLLKNKADVTLFDVNFKMAINYCTENTKEYRLISDALIMANGRRLGLDVSTLTPLEPFTYF
ncbi:uncharacterized protein LOC136076484 [Hydra vulgaris]|uniref:Uncharacterized protein LOC136076484 n=1 Tax=Hydra vulgaris TaxID=6087 RepID=A0ABM4BAI0_HYDVU